MEVDEEGKPVGQTSRHRTGTLPYMARDLLTDMNAVERDPKNHKPLPHCVRFDYESLFFCVLALAITTIGPAKGKRKSTKPTLEEWESGSYAALARVKRPRARSL